MNVKYNSEKSKKTKKTILFNLYSEPKKRNKSLHKIYTSEKENINIINIQNHNIEKKEDKKEIKKQELDFNFYKDLTNDSFVDDFFSSLNNTFTIFNSINNILYLVYSNKEKSIISYDLKNFQKICEIKNAHNKYITNFTHTFDKMNKRDLIMSISPVDNNIKIWNANNWECILEIKQVNKGGVVYSASFLLDINDIYILTSNYNLLSKKEPIKLFNTKAEKIYEIKLLESIVYTDCYYENDFSQIFIIIVTQNKIFSYDYMNNCFYNEYGKIKSTYFSIIIHKKNNDTKLFASNFNGGIEIYDFHSGKELKEIKIHSRGFFGICLWDDNHLLVACYDKSIKIIDLKEKKIKKSLNGHKKYVTTLKKIYIPNVGDCLISQGMTSDSIKLWKVNK